MISAAPSARSTPCRIRTATAQDVDTVLFFIQALAEYEKLSHVCVATRQSLLDTVFAANSHVKVLLIEEQRSEQIKGQPVGFALFFYNYSTFLAKPGIYLEDLFVLPAHRGHGHGKALMLRLAQIAVTEGCGRFEWSVLDWNQPSIDFYRSIGAVGMDEWRIQRLTGDALVALAASAT